MFSLLRKLRPAPAGHQPRVEMPADWVKTPAQALEAMAGHRGLLVVDFDETLYLRNSTEDFIGCALPGLLGRLVMKALDVVRPWAFTGGHRTRDAWRVRVAALAPFAWSRWRARAARLAPAETNPDIRTALLAREDAVVATLGFEPVVGPLLDAMGLGSRRLVACGFGSFADRRAGKLALLRRSVDEEAVAGCALLTDSADDTDLLERCALPLFVIWPRARWVPAHADVYLPLQYTHLVKKPGMRFVASSILGDDYVVWLLASIALASAALPHALGLLALLLSFWAVYELGYVDNDEIGARYEADPVLSDAFHARRVRTSVLQAWIWALVSGAIGIALLERSLVPSAGALAAWLAVLAVVHGMYRLFNRVDKKTRIWLYAPLQLARSAVFLAVVPVTAVGAAAIGAHALTRWMMYFIYRSFKVGWPDEAPLHVVRLLAFATLLVPTVAAGGFGSAEIATAALLLAWFTARCGPRLLAIARGAHLIVRTEPGEARRTPQGSPGTRVGS